MDFHENDLISLYLSELKKIEDFNSAKQKIQLYSHSQLGKVLIINNEIQHIEKYQVLYHELLVHLPTAFIPEIRNVLILGGGSLFAANEVLKYPTIESVTLCDYDHEVLDLMDKYYNHAKKVRNDARFRYIEQDAKKYIKNENNKYDLIINDCFNLIKESENLEISLYSQCSNLCSQNGLCVDIIYRHIFDTQITQNSLIELKKQNNLALSLVAIPEYPGILHLETIWGKSRYLSQTAKKPVNFFQLKKIINDPQIDFHLEYFNPAFLPFYLYLPPYIKNKFTL